MKMKKSLLAVLVCVMMAAALVTGCGKKNTNPSPAPEPEPVAYADDYCSDSTFATLQDNYAILQ